jgi:hypothetical protein
MGRYTYGLNGFPMVIKERKDIIGMGNNMVYGGIGIPVEF